MHNTLHTVTLIMAKKQANPLMRSKKKYDSPLRRNRPSLQPQMRNRPINIPAGPRHAFLDDKQVDDHHKFATFPLLAASNQELQGMRYHIMRLHSKKTVDPAEFALPVTLHRKDPQNIQFQATQEEQAAGSYTGDKQAVPYKREKADISQIAPDGGARAPRKSRFSSKKKVKMTYKDGDDEAKNLRYEEYYPWVMEDYSGKNTFVGNYEAGLSDSYCLFFLRRGGFKVVPVDKFYKFTPRNQYATLTLDEAEKRMEQSAKSGTPRWLMKHIAPEKEQSNRNLQTIVSGRIGNEGESRRRDRDEEDLDFDDVFDDDEEAPIMEGDEEDQREVERKVKNEHRSDSALKDEDNFGDLFGENGDEEKIGKEGRKLRRSLQSLEGNSHYDSDDEENPYASSSSSEEEVNQISVKEEVVVEEPLPVFVRKTITGLPKGVAVIQMPPQVLSMFPRGVWNPKAKRRRTAKSDVPPPSSKRSRSAKRDPPPPAKRPETRLTDEQILTAIRTRPPMTIQDLINFFMPIIKLDGQNKMRLRTCVKLHARVQNGVLLLKEE